ncbi:MAG: isoleucine--tRNA ligase [Phycisphaerae bacterium]|jgi:isoleucyl-tRNA synthetase
MFAPLPARFSFPESELRVLEFWQKLDVFGKSLEIRQGAPRFVFYEGPPTANGLPHPGHCLTRAIKDLFPRYQTMCGRLVERKAGWDTHGLPVEVEVCKQLGIHTKEEIETYGVEKFVRRCIESVFRYTREWEQMTRRLGFWVNLEEAYVTFHQSYVESVWWSLKTLFERGLLYQGHKVVWWWAQGGTALSAGEVGEGYRTVDDPSVYIRFPLLRTGDEPAKAVADAVSAPRGRRCPHDELPADAKVSLLVWTTTPWTLISNHFAAVGPDIDYSLVLDKTTGEYLYIATALVITTAAKVQHELESVANCKGTDLVGRRYVPPFPESYYQRPVGGKPMGEATAALREPAGGQDYIGWRVTLADFVTLDSGSGLVHEAPAYGEVDFELLQGERRRFEDELNGIPLINAVNPDGKFNDEAPEPYRGRWVKECDKDIIRELNRRGILYHQEIYRHEYPFCPRAEDDALIQYARKSWFVRTSQFKDDFLANNDQINWLPEHIKEGRFGDFLRNNVDWALSRERYWGTPLPIWVCEQTGKMEAIGSLAELMEKPGVTDRTPDYPQGMWATKKAEDPTIPDHLRVHKPYIDAVTYDSPFAKGARMRRVPEVIDCWWDAGSMPFAQWGFPHTPNSVRTFDERFPADFISEAIDQTRGWFYGLAAISTLLFRKDSGGGGDTGPARDYPHPYKTCIVLGHVMGEDGLKMSKRTKNYKEPDFIFDHYGADAMRWYFFSGQVPWTSVRFQEAPIRDAQREFLLRLYNVFSFFNIYANIDGFDPAAAELRPAAERCELDRWILSMLHGTIRDVRASLDRFENYPAAGRLNEFVDALSNWYVRRSRERFWRSEKNQDKWDAYHTLYECLVALSKLVAPFTPFFAETMYQNLVRGEQTMQETGDTGGPPVSVHLCDYPVVDEALIDEALAQEMDLVRQVVSLGRAARTGAKLKVRQPLALAEIILVHGEHTEWLAAHSELIAEELNIKAVEFTTEAEHYVTYQVKPNFQTIGPKFGKLAPQIAKALGGVDAADARKTLATTGELALDVGGQSVRLATEDLEIRLEAKPGWSAAQGRAGVVVVKTELTPELKDEGLVREAIHHVQALRKDGNLAYEARIALEIDAPAALRDVLDRYADTIRRECLAERIEFSVSGTSQVRTVKIESYEVRLAIVGG